MEDPGLIWRTRHRSEFCAVPPRAGHDGVGSASADQHVLVPRCHFSFCHNTLPRGLLRVKGSRGSRVLLTCSCDLGVQDTFSTDASVVILSAERQGMLIVPGITHWCNSPVAQQANVQQFRLPVMDFAMLVRKKCRWMYLNTIAGASRTSAGRKFNIGSLDKPWSAA